MLATHNMTMAVTCGHTVQRLRQESKPKNIQLSDDKSIKLMKLS